MTGRRILLNHKQLLPILGNAGKTSSMLQLQLPRKTVGTSLQSVRSSTNSPTLADSIRSLSLRSTPRISATAHLYHPLLLPNSRTIPHRLCRTH